MLLISQSLMALCTTARAYWRAEMNRIFFSADYRRAGLFAVGAIWLSMIVLLQVVPRLYPPVADLPNVASLLGYNIPLAYALIVGVTLVAGLSVGFMARWEPEEGREQATATVSAPPGRGRRSLELLAIAAAVAVLYWPSALARFGPHIEDHYFLATLWRIVCGQVPYTDFEFLYGPLMIGLPAGWASISGFSMTGYYTLYLVMQAVFYLIVALILQRNLPVAWQRYLAFLTLFAFTFDNLLGLNWIAWRYFTAALVILVVAANPTCRLRGLTAGALIGLQAAYSHEYGMVALLSVAVMYGVMLFQPERWRPLSAGLIAAVTAVAVWASVSWLLVGHGFADYIESLRHVSAVSAAMGLGQFAFGWSLNSLALFLVLASALVLFTGSLAGLGRRPVSRGDLHLIGATVFAAIALRIVLQRADFIHLAAAFVPLMLVLMLNQPRSLLAVRPAVRQVALAAIAVAAVTQAAGHLHHGRWVMFSQARGLLHEIQGRPVVGGMVSRAPSIYRERSVTHPDIVALAAGLAEPNMSGRPVLFYGSTWSASALTGACPQGYSFYDILYSDERRPLAGTLADHKDLVVVMRQGDHARLFEGAPPEPAPPLSGLLRVLTWTSSAHFPQTSLENEIEYSLWAEALGEVLATEFALFATIGKFVLLERPVQ